MKASTLSSEPGILGGRACFRGTSVPMTAVLESILAQGTLDDFLAEHPEVERGDAETALDELKQAPFQALSTDPDRMGDSLCFPGTRVPFYVLTDYFIGGSPLSEFETDFPQVNRNDILSALREAIAHSSSQ